jgi:tetratricopeptide (TPR) repeat protein
MLLQGRVFQTVKKGALSLFIVGLVFVSGCAVVDSTSLPDSNLSSIDSYQSELTDPEAKAFFAFCEFRVLGAENRWEEAISALERAVDFDPQSEYLQLLLAKVYLHQGQPQRAVTVLDQFLTKNPDSVVGHTLLGDIFNYQHDYVAALGSFLDGLKLSPDDPDLQLRQALALAHLNRTDEAITVLDGLLKQQPENLLAQLALARFYIKQSKLDKATSLYERLMEQEPVQPQAVLEYGHLLEQQDPDAAYALYRSFVTENPRAVGIRQRLAQYYLMHGQRKDALAQYQIIRQQLPDSLRVVNQIGLVHLELENWSEAEKDFRLLLDKGYQQDSSRYYLAMALTSQQKITEAIAVLEPLTENSPVYTEARLQLAYLYKQSGQNDKAVIVLEKMVEHGILHPEVYYYLIAFLGDRADYERALSVAIAATEKFPDNTQLLYQLGVLYEKIGKRQIAVATMEKVLALDAAHADALNFLAYDQAERGENLPLALSRAEKALESKPSGYIIDTLGWIYYKMGRYPESRKQLEKAAELHPEDAVIGEHLGDLYVAMKLWDKAKTVYRRVLETNPEMKQVEEKLENIVREGH